MNRKQIKQMPIADFFSFIKSKETKNKTKEILQEVHKNLVNENDFYICDSVRNVCGEMKSKFYHEINEFDVLQEIEKSLLHCIKIAIDFEYSIGAWLIVNNLIKNACAEDIRTRINVEYSKEVQDYKQAWVLHLIEELDKIQVNSK